MTVDLGILSQDSASLKPPEQADARLTAPAPPPPSKLFPYQCLTTLPRPRLTHARRSHASPQVIVGFTCVTIAGAVGQFYWAGGDSAKLSTFPVLTSLKNTVVYHMGSIAFGAFIIAVIQLVR